LLRSGGGRCTEEAAAVVLLGMLGADYISKVIKGEVTMFTA
jgi:hypothetical protein